MTAVDHIRGLLALSVGFWMLFFLFISIRIQLFIVKRYEHESDLLNTVCFREHATFTRILPDFLSSSIYVAHLLSVVWLWNICSKKKTFRDIESPNEIMKYFSIKEIRRVKWFAYSALILFIFICFYLLAGYL